MVGAGRWTISLSNGYGERSSMKTFTSKVMRLSRPWKRASRDFMFYNPDQPHQIMGYRTPAEVHRNQ